MTTPSDNWIMKTHQGRFIYVTLEFLCGFMIAFTMASPGKPTGLEVTKVENLNISLTWRRPATTLGAPDDSNLTYIVRYRPEGGVYQRLFASVESAQLVLLPDKRYYIHVKARRESVEGAWSETLEVKSWDLVPAKPSNVRIIGVNGLKVDVAWEEPTKTTQGIPDTSILNYKVAYKDMYAGRAGERKQILTTTESASLFLRANTQYIVQVRAVKTFNNKVYGPWSEALRLLSNESVPSKPPSNVRVISNTSSSIYISWGPIPEADRNGIVRGYVVFYQQQDAANWSMHDVKGALHWQLAGLLSGERYSFRVAGYTKEGNGPRSRVKRIIVAGLLSSTTKKPATTTPLKSPTTEKSTSTTKHTTSQTTASQTSLASRTTGPGGHASTTTAKTGILAVSLTSTSTDSIREESKEDLASSTAATLQSRHSTLPAVMARKGDNEAKENFLNKIILIGAPAGFVFLLLVVIILFFVCRRKRARERKKELDGFPLKTITSSHKAKKTRGGVTRGRESIRYEPPPAHLTSTGDDPEIDEHRPHQPMIIVQQPGSSACAQRSTGDEESQLLCPEYPKTLNLLPVDENVEKNQLENGRTSGLYESIGSLGGGRCDPQNKQNTEQEEEERYVTQDQIAAKREDSQKNPAQGAPHEYSHLKVQPTNDPPRPPEATYENVRDSVHFYETLSFGDQRGPFARNKKPMSSFAPKGNPSVD